MYCLLIILLWGVSQGELHMLLNFGKEMLIIMGVHQNKLYSYFGGFKYLDCYYLIVCCSLDPIFII